MPVKIYSGIAPPQALLDAMAASGQPPKMAKPNLPSGDTMGRPPVPPRPNNQPIPAGPDDVYDEAPPSYEDAMAESLSPVDGPRREYNPPTAPSPSARERTEPGADAKSPVDPRIADSARASVLHGSNAAAHSSTESFDMLPATPPEPHSGSPPMSPASRPVSTTKLPGSGGRQQEEHPPQYQSVSHGQLPAPERSVERRPSRMNLGVPSRKPVPGASSPRGS